tara:strand:- start:35536 stop:37134 length:1599 start_codon:yes stop_codon:yes gene_type:complete
LQALERWVKSPYFLSIARVSGHYGLALVLVLVPEIGDNRVFIAGLLAFVIGPLAFVVSVRGSLENGGWIDPLIDLVSTLVVVAFLPSLWHLGLLLGVVIAQAPSQALTVNSTRRYTVSMVTLVVGMSLIGATNQISDWQVSIAILIAVYPAVLMYHYSQSGRVREMRQKAESLTALQLLSGGVAHDFNNILTAISGYAEFAKGTGYEPQATERVLDKIINSSERAGLLTQQLISFSGDKQRPSEAVDIGHEVRSLADMLEDSPHSDVKFEIEAPSTAVLAMGDPVKLHQVLLNLMINGLEASSKHGVVRVRVSSIGDSVQIEVADEGDGISEAIKTTMFQPFVSSKENGHGLGLAVVKNVVDEHNGTIDVVSNVGMGARFIVRLPAAEAPPVSVTVQEVKSTILIADDETPIRVILRQVLEMEGFDVVEAEDGLQFLELFKLNKNKLCLVILDIKMPGRTGWQCLDEVRRTLPDLPALMISGYDPDGPTIERPDYATKFMPKPFRIAEVKDSIYELLDEPREKPQSSPRHVS